MSNDHLKLMRVIMALSIVGGLCLCAATLDRVGYTSSNRGINIVLPFGQTFPLNNSMPNTNSIELDRTVVLIICGLWLLAYWLPALIAHCRHHPNEVLIFWINLLLGITGIGWLAALGWALVDGGKPQQVVLIQPPTEGKERGE
ncbi:superinfection immunity protein [Telmatocola sphagniphila]|uniref:Superinfection immunity protein n=1 Tax=Telmatocola sphagniphila TaxID=1123043 RepID=A0A8E6B737_9BACT|nr:superinfection immunity protein [Telmatocola sphagniphila]QVL32669.1 superinfection immunity protein [Telmatocola sphagniphila]